MPGSTILVAVSDAALSSAMSADLEQSGYAVQHAHRANEVFLKTKEIQPDLLVIEEQFAQDSGLDVCKQLRLDGVVFPLLAVMNADTVEDRVACLLAGADDYFVKPYRSETFVKQIRLYLQPASASQGESLKFDNLVLDLSARVALRGGQVISLTMKEYDLLKYLMEHPREVLTRDQILENVWGYDFLGESNVIEVYIRYLRLKIEGEGEKKLIYTVRGVGYALRDA
ncbi:response regulator transcription factor NblR [Altericista sp. CCNU0014]|uniref:response regulator transcription factor NblR n=1 Tax=Altericista sp. CCNU0014 TaxID=3082949 RepID=UPI003850CF01